MWKFFSVDGISLISTEKQRKDNKKVGTLFCIVFSFYDTISSLKLFYCVSSLRKEVVLTLYLLIFRDRRLHKWIFEDGGLPDGIEVAYYSAGQVVNTFEVAY